MIDSHTHLHLCGDDADQTVRAAVAAGVTRMLTVGTDGESSRKALAAAESHPEVWAAVGCHPNSATGFDDAAMGELGKLAAHPRCVAIGETGIDLYRDGAPLDDQRRAFIAQCGLARELDKALVIHTRAADDETLSILRSEAQGLRVILHCFSMPHALDECVAEGFWISFAGNVTYPSAEDLRAAARAVPAERLLVETDAPYLTPQPLRGEPNRPANVVLTAELIARERNVGLEELAAGMEVAAAEVFGW